MEDDGGWPAGGADDVAEGRPTPRQLADLELRLHDLQVRQTELEISYEALRASHGELEASRTHLADLYDFAPIVYLTLDPECRVVAANLTAASMFGRERGRLIGSHLTALVTAGERAALRGHVQRCLMERLRVDDDLSFTIRGRPKVTAQVTSMPLLDAAGNVAGCKTVLTDITSLTWSQTKLQFLTRASALLGSSFDTVASLTQVTRLAVPALADVCILDLVGDRGEIRRLEAAFADEALAVRLELLRAVAPRASEGTALARVLRTREPLLYTDCSAARLASSGGIDHEIFVRAVQPRSLMYVPIVGRSEVMGVLTLMAAQSGRSYTGVDVATMRDLAGRAAMAMENARLYEQAQQAIAMRQDMLSFVSHDLKNPLMGIMLSTETILRHAPDNDRRRSSPQLQRIRRAAMQMRRMIEDLLDMTALEAGRLTVEIAAHEAGSVLTEAREMFAPAASARNLQLDVESPATPIAVACDRQRLVQVLGNLLDNAIKFSRPGGRVALSARSVGPSALFAVADNGPGISPWLRPRIFERFSQASETARQGRGLGLFITKGLVEAQHGAIWVDSDEGAGATFSFTLPLAVGAAMGTLGSMDPSVGQIAPGSSVRSG